MLRTSQHQENCYKTRLAAKRGKEQAAGESDTAIKKARCRSNEPLLVVSDNP